MTARLALGLFLAPLLLAALLLISVSTQAARSSRLELRVYALSPGQLQAYQSQATPRLPWLIKNHQPLKDRIEIDRRTEFYAVLISADQAMRGQAVRIKWLYGTDNYLYIRPDVEFLHQPRGYEKPMALSAIWSAPAKSGKLYSGLMGGGGMNRAKWERSRCYGPRTVQIFDMAGKLLAQKSFEIYPAGTQIY